MGHTWEKVFAERAELISSTGLATWAASTLSFLLTYGFGLALVTGLSWYQRFRDSQSRFAALEQSMSATRLAALRMQLSPHTLFNLLHTIRGQIGWDPASAQTMVVQLGDVLRRLLLAGERDFSRLADEFEFVRLYLELQRSRFSDRLTFSMSDPLELSTLWVPSLILQPLVENAVAHGLAGHTGPVHVSVEASANQDVLKMTVTNSTAEDVVAGAQGIGLRNVRERLVLHFPDTATFGASPASGQSWVAQIQMPLVHDARGGRHPR
jgi:two-component system, LytTR family, sensor kinase